LLICFVDFVVSDVNRRLRGRDGNGYRRCEEGTVMRIEANVCGFIAGTTRSTTTRKTSRGRDGEVYWME